MRGWVSPSEPINPSKGKIRAKNKEYRESAVRHVLDGIYSDTLTLATGVLPLNSSLMLCRLRALILLFVMFWQTMATFGQVTVAQRIGELKHLAVHSQGTKHHHHPDNTVHINDDGPFHHMHESFEANTVGLLTSLLNTDCNIRSMSPPETRYVIWRSPTLEGPLRPPMLNV